MVSNLEKFFYLTVIIYFVVIVVSLSTFMAIVAWPTMLISVIFYTLLDGYVYANQEDYV